MPRNALFFRRFSCCSSQTDWADGDSAPNPDRRCWDCLLAGAIGCKGRAANRSRFKSRWLRDTFTCKSTKGCGEPGNKCQIDRLVTDVAGIRGNFTWGGSCSLYDKTAGRNKLPNKAPDPTKEREELARDIYAKVQEPDGEDAKGIIALTDVFELKSLAPFFASFVRALGFEPMVFTEANQRILRKGIEISEVPWCAPMQMFYGVAEQMAQSDVDFILVPMIRELPRPADERTSVTCPVVQSAPALLRQSIWRRGDAPKLLDPVIEVGPEGIHSKDFKKSVRNWQDLGRGGKVVSGLEKGGNGPR